MKIKKLDMVGFKSFVDKTTVHFDHDVTGVVGPNGCGKSNVVDAIKWVMGEQSAKSLRGAAMGDVIFSGSDARGPAQFAEVTITFDNTDGLASPEYRDYSEIAVSRKLDRQGRSDYFINKTPVRLLDITNLFLGTGVGRRAYSIIEQGRVGSIVTSKPEDRRQIIEEAAGITKFKVRRKAAEKKMEQTRENLTRVDDICRELEKSLASLKRQAAKAERYKEYRAEQRDLELWVGAFRYLQAFTERRSVERLLEVDSAEVEGVRYALAIREAETETERVALDRASNDVERAQGVTYALDNEVRMLEGQLSQQRERVTALVEREQAAELELAGLAGQYRKLRDEKEDLERAIESVRDLEEDAADHLERETEALHARKAAVEEAQRAVTAARQRASEAQTRIARGEAQLVGFVRRREEADIRIGRLRAEREDLESSLLDVEQRRSESQARFDGLRSGRAASAERRATCETELAAAREELVSLDGVVDSLRDDVTQKRSRLRSLTELAQRFEGVGTGARALMTTYANNDATRAEKGLCGLVVDRIECDPEYTRALASALGDRLHNVVVEELAHGLDALAYLRGDKKGRATLVARHDGASKASAPDVTGVPGLVARLADVVRSAPDDADLVNRLLGRVVIVETIEDALAARRAGHAEVTFVSRAGEVLGVDGTLTGGTADDAGEHVLGWKREMRELESVVGELGARFDASLARQSELRSSVASLAAELESAKNEAHGAEIALVGAEKDLRRAEEETTRIRGRVEDLVGEIEDIVFAREQVESEEETAREAIERAREDELGAEEELTSKERAFEDRRDAVDMQNERVTEVRLRATQARERAQGDRAALDRVQRAVRELDEREQRLRRDVLSFAQQQGRIYGEMVVQKETLDVQLGSAMHAARVLESMRAAYDVARVAAGANDGDIRALRQRIDVQSQRVSELTIRQRELTLSIDHLLETIRDRHEVDIRKQLGDYHQRELPTPDTLQRIDELGKLIQRMGDINLLAIEEFEEQNKRFEYLSAQRKDLLDALGQLERAIKQMNKESRQLFKDAFDGIDQRFRLVFPRLFRGGEAKIVLTNPDDLLESGVDIVCQPPGKRLGSLELMSGGEKALTAVALIFAIFQYKPSPFCILDEVDAPLDEANVTRYADAIRQMTDRSQFIVITHSKRTMETADVLYGVTMEQPGISKLVAVELRGDRRPVRDDRAASAA